MKKNTPLIVLLHGAWLGGYCWYKLIPALSARGLPVIAPTLQGCAERYDASAAGIGLHHHVDEVVELVQKTGADNVVLVGHSYGGLVACEAAARLGKQTGKIIVLDSFLCAAGEAITDAYAALAGLFESLITSDAPDFVQPATADLLGLTPGLETDWLTSQLRPMPLKAFAEPCQHSVGDLSERHYIRFSGFPLFADTADQAGREGWLVQTIDAGHMAIITHAELIAERIAAISLNEKS